MSLGQFSGQPLPPEREPRCPNCGAAIKQGAARCWMCEELVGSVGQREGPSLLDQDLAERIKLPRNQPDVAMYVVGFIAMIIVGLGVGLVAPGLWIILLIAGLPAIIYFPVEGRKHGNATSPAMKALGIVATIALVGITSVVAFFITCFAVCFGSMAISPQLADPGPFIFYASIGSGAVVALAIAALLIRHFRSRRG